MSTNGKGRTKKAAVNPPFPLDGDNGQLMVLAAFRYCLGSRTYIVGACVEWLELWWPKVAHSSRRTIVRDTVEALMDERTGFKCDVDCWVAFGSWAYDQMGEDDRAWVREAVSHKNKPWPLIEPAIPEVGG